MTLHFSGLLGSILVASLIFDFPGLARAQVAQAQAEPQDPPGRVGRLSFIEGAVQQRSADDADWSQANLNFPVSNGFALATRENGRAEIQVGSMAVRLGSDSELSVDDLGDHGTTLTLAQGEINLRLGQLPQGDRVEIVTPRGITDIVGPGHYHFDAGTTDEPTRVAVFNGRVEVPREGGLTILTDGRAALITGDDASGLRLAAVSRDPLDEWAIARDRGPGPSTAQGTVTPQRRVSPEMTGGADLDQYGAWRQDPRYGNVWQPRDPPSDWAPYRQGHWSWVSPWGWTWVDDAPWGFAPYHYGRWVWTANGWAWVPGDYVDYPVYAPALVGWVGGGWGGGWGWPWVGWFPLAPFEFFVPSFFVSIDFVRRVNVANVVNVTNINITRVNGAIVVDNTTTTTISSFTNRQFVTTVSTNSFTSGATVSKSIVNTTAIDPKTTVSTSPTNVTSPRMAAITRASATTTAASDPPRTAGDPPRGQRSLPALPGSSAAARTPTGGTAGSRGTSAGAGGSTAASMSTTGSRGTSAGAGSSTAASMSTTGGHKLPPLPQARTTGSRGTSAGAGSSTAASISTTSGHKLPPLPQARTPSSVPAAVGGAPRGVSSPVDRRMSSPMDQRMSSPMDARHSPATVTPSAPSAGSSPMANASRGGSAPQPPPANASRGGGPQPPVSRGGGPQPPAAMMSHGGGPQPGMMPPMHAPMSSFAPSHPHMGPMMPRGPSMQSAPRVASPPMQSGGFMQRRGG